MSMSRLSPFNIRAPGGPSEELVATVPDLHFGVVPVSNCITDLSYPESFTNPRKRSRNDSGCSLSDFEISGDEDFSFCSKRSCVAIPTPRYSPVAYPSTKEFTLELDAVLQFADTGAVSSGRDINTSQSYSDYPVCLRTTPVFTGMQTSELQTNPYKQDLMLNCDQNCKLVIAEHPEEVRPPYTVMLQT